MTVTLDAIPLTPNQACVIAAQGGEGLLWRSGRVLRRAEDLLHVVDESASETPIVEHVGEQVAVEIWRVGDALYSMRGVVTAVDGGPGEIGIRVLDWDRVQRRQYFRVPVMLDVSNATTMSSTGEDVPLSMQIFDISAGGVGARSTVKLTGDSNLALEIGSEIRFTVLLPGESRPLELCARVVRLGDDTVRTSLNQRFEIGAAFVDLAPRAQERLIHAVLQVQKLHARRGLL